MNLVPEPRSTRTSSRGAPLVRIYKFIIGWVGVCGWVYPLWKIVAVSDEARKATNYGRGLGGRHSTPGLNAMR